MPTGKVYSKHERKWVNKSTERPNDYDKNVSLAAALLLTYWRLYPDRYMAFCEAEQPDYRLAPIQCMMLRAEARYQNVFVTGTRGMGKTYVGMAGRLCFGNLYPGVKMPYYGPSLKQTAKLCSEAFKELIRNYPLLVEGWSVVHDAEAKFEIVNKQGSRIEVGVMRGDNAYCVFCEEVAQQEDGELFDHEKYQTVVRKAVRKERIIKEKRDPMFPAFQKVYVTTANDQQNPSFEYRKDCVRDCAKGLSSIAMDIPAEVAVLNGIRPLDWYLQERDKTTADKWLVEMAARWSGTSVNPVIRSGVLYESASVMLMENRHCGDPNVIYVIGYDVSYAEGGRNAKCATVVLKLERYPNTSEYRYKQDRYLKSIVYVLNEEPRENMLQARILKDRWHHFTLESGNPTYIAIDAKQYGQAVYENLHKDLGDGLPALCSVNHERPEIEQLGALPVIHPINATGGSASIGADLWKESEQDMVRYAEVEWEQRNVKMLVSNVNEGVLAFKRAHRIKDDMADSQIGLPYRNTKILSAQIANLRKKRTSTGFTVERATKTIQKDIWSAAEYALRVAQRLEYLNLAKNAPRENQWTQVIKTGALPQPKPNPQYTAAPMNSNPRGIGRTGGNLRR